MTSKRSWALAFAALLFFGCRMAPILNVQDSPILPSARQEMTLLTVEQAIIRAGSDLGWKMTVEKPGLITASLNLRHHLAMVEIPYSTTSYSIRYKFSANLPQRGEKIHRNYNLWIRNLDAAIKHQLENERGDAD